VLWYSKSSAKNESNQTTRLAIFDGIFCTGRATHTVWKRASCCRRCHAAKLRSQCPAVESTQPILRARSHLQAFPSCGVCHEAPAPILSFRSRTRWLFGHPEAALKDADDALKIAREVGEAATLMFALVVTEVTQIMCGNYAAAAAQAQRLITEAEQTGSLYWKALGMMQQGSLLVLTGEAAKAIQMLTVEIASWRSTGSTLYMPFYLSYLARAYVELGQFDEASRCIGEAMTGSQTAKERWCQADIHRTAGEFALMLPEPDAAKAKAHFEQALTIAREQNAKSWELRVATSIARFWRNQGRRQEARDLLAPIYGWFTEGFDTRDLKEANALLDELAK
jgi:predicted ATPase